MKTSGSQRRWRAVRQYLDSSRAVLTRTAAGLEDDWPQAAGLIVPDGWRPAEPVPLEEVRLRWRPEVAAARVTGREQQALLVCPLRADGQRAPSYAAAISEVAPPSNFVNRPCYRLVEVADTTLSFGQANYFDGLDVAEAMAHELAAVWMASADRGGRANLSRTDLPLRTLVGEPADLTGRTVVPAICALTVRHDPGSGEASFLLHRRDPERVASGGGLYHVAPVGVFQPAGTAEGAVPESSVRPEAATVTEAGPTQATATVANGSRSGETGAGGDFDLWRCLARELSEELLGAAEHGAIDYPSWPFWQRLEQARVRGGCRAYYLGAGVDPLTYAVDLLTVTVFEAADFDELFAGLVADNDEGELVTGIGFTEENLHRYATSEPMQPAGAALLEAAWRHRKTLLG